MGLFGGSKSSSSSNTTNYTTTISQATGDLAHGNIQGAGDITVNGLWGDEMMGFLDTINQVASGNADLAGKSIEQVAKGYQSAYSETTGMLQQLKPVLMVGVGLLALMYGVKYLK